MYSQSVKVIDCDSNRYVHNQYVRMYDIQLEIIIILQGSTHIRPRTHYYYQPRIFTCPRKWVRRHLCWRWLNSQRRTTCNAEHSKKVLVTKLLRVQTQSSDGPIELIIRVRDHTYISQHRGPFCKDIRFTYQDWLKTPSIASCSHSPFGCCRDISNFMALRRGSLWG